MRSPLRRPSWFTSLVLISIASHAVLNGVRTLISYRALALGGDALSVGIVTASFAVLPLLVALPIGRAVDRGHGMRVLRGGLVLTVGAVVLAATSTNLGVLAGASALLGFGQILHTIACQSLIPLWSPPELMDKRFGQLTLGVSAGQFLGFPLAGIVATLSNSGAGGDGTLKTTFSLIVMAAVATAAVPLAYAFSPASRAVRSRREQVGTQQSSLTILRQPGMKPAMYSSMTVLSGLDLLTAYVPVLGEHLGLSVGMVTFLLTMRALASVLSRIALPALLVHVGRRWLIVSATLVSAIPVALIPLTTNVVALSAAMLVIGFFWGIGQPLTMVWVTTVSHRDNRATALSLRLAGNRIAQFAVPLGAGAVAGATGVGVIFYLTAGLLASSGLLSLSATRRMPD
ncbi:MFS transporter [Aeromicrobium yanjiei]|uniref:MFS transporter n=1 Tax=Aeromicrobium yanjiei TaxID=2662028 RepID=UPI001ABB53D9|nr:MFS transporter [Aeromicrobium yanjiei]